MSDYSNDAVSIVVSLISLAIVVSTLNKNSQCHRKLVLAPSFLLFVLRNGQAANPLKRAPIG